MHWSRPVSITHVLLDVRHLVLRPVRFRHFPVLKKETNRFMRSPRSVCLPFQFWISPPIFIKLGMNVIADHPYTFYSPTDGDNMADPRTCEVGATPVLFKTGRLTYGNASLKNVQIFLRQLFLTWRLCEYCLELSDWRWQLMYRLEAGTWNVVRRQFINMRETLLQIIS
jgi:hypothetical protein